MARQFYVDIFDRIKITQILDPTSGLTATQTSAEFDSAGYESVFFVVSYGECADTLSGTVYWTAKIRDCATSGGTYADLAAAEVYGATANAFGLINDPAEDDALYCLAVRSSERYLKVVVTPTGSHSSGTPIAVYAVGLKSLSGNETTHLNAANP